MEICLGSCNNRCEFCHLSETPEISRMISEARGSIVFSGGDPGVRKDVFELIAMAKAMGLHVTIETGGRSFYYKSFARKMADSRVDRFRIYFFGDEHSHDTITRVPGSHAQTMKGISNLAEFTSKLEIELRVLGSLRPNIESYRSHFRAQGIDFKATRIHYSSLGRDLFDEMKASVGLSPEDFMQKFIRLLPTGGMEAEFLSSLKETLEHDLERFMEIEKPIPPYLKSYFYAMPFNLPDRVSIATSSSCNLHCRVCTSWKYARPGVMSLSDIESIVHRIGEWNPKAELILCGPEPLNNKETLLRALEVANGIGLRTGLVTNGQLVTESLAKSIMAYEPAWVVVSLDGSTPETHDHIRDCPGAFDKAMQALRLFVIHKGNSYVSASAVVNSCNIQQLVPMAKMLEQMGVDGVDYNPYLLSNSFQGHTDYSDPIWVGDDNIESLSKAVAQLIEMKRGRGIGIVRSEKRLRLMPGYFRMKSGFRKEHAGFCLSGYSYFNIDCTGVVSVCEKGPNVDVRSRSLPELWDSYEFWLARLNARACREGCIDGCYEKVDFKTLELI
jgi:MoaA/NifB/PqqE/SkfB family radical SAM enzyme